MRAYVIGAGVSKSVGYPLGIELFDAVDKFVRLQGKTFNRFQFDKDWPALKRWLARHRNPIVSEAYRSRQLEHLFTVLDLAENLRIDSLGAILAASKRGKKAVSLAESRWRSVEKNSRSYQKYRQILLWALETYLEFKNYEDCRGFSDASWETLRTFGNKLCPGDVVLTFNYDSTLERILQKQGKWSPRDGYGFELVFQESYLDKTPIGFPKSPVRILHLHGSVGWYRKPAIREEFRLKLKDGAIPRDVLTPAPLETPIALDPIFLRDLGIQAVDASLPHRPPDERQIFIHPSFLKEFEGGAQGLFTSLWRQAADALRAAEEIIIIGYSLPGADSAALTLLLTNCDQFKVQIVNRDRATTQRLIQLLARRTGEHWLSRPAISFEEWLRTVPNF